MGPLERVGNKQTTIDERILKSALSRGSGFEMQRISITGKRSEGFHVLVSHLELVYRLVPLDEFIQDSMAHS